LNTIEGVVKESSFLTCYRAFGRIPFLIVSSSILVSMTSSMVLLASFILQGASVHTTLLVAAFALTFAVYNFDRVINQKEDMINDPDRSKLYMSKETVWTVVAAASLALAAVLGAREGLSVLLTLLSPLAVYAGYTLGLPWTGRLKAIPVVKNVVLVATWALVPTLLPRLCEDGPAGGVSIVLSLLVLYFIFTKIMVNSVLFDLRDVEGDSASGVRTLPQVLGVKGVRRLLFLLNATLVLWLVVCWLLGFFLQYLPILAANIVYGFWYVHFFTRSLGEKRILVDFLVDGEWIPLAMAIALVFASSWASW